MPRLRIVALVVSLVIACAAPASARAQWKLRIDKVVAGKSVGVAVAQGGVVLYQHRASSQRTPASNEKITLAMALLEAFGPGFRLTTTIRGAPPRDGSVGSNLWVAGTGDPSVGRSSYVKRFPFKATGIGKIARAIKSAGIRSISGGIKGSTGYFGRDWFAPGWEPDFPAEQVPLPTALTFNGNTRKGRHVSNPEFLFAQALTRRLEKLGVWVGGKPGAGAMPARLSTIATVESAPLSHLVRFMNRKSSNFFAEVLTKRLGVKRSGAPGTIAKGAAAIAAYAARASVPVKAYDGSGLSYSNKVSPLGLVNLLSTAQSLDWARVLFNSLPKPGQGTLDDRLKGVPVRAKTGSLRYISALSGYVYLTRTGKWAEFSILDAGIAYGSSDMEDRIVRILSRAAR